MTDTATDENPPENSAALKKRRSRKIWHYIPPNLPLKQAAYFELPFSIIKSLKYLLYAWSPLTERFFILAAAVAIWTWFTPSLDRTVTFQFDWMFEIWLRNFILVLTVAGGLHLWFFTFRGQNDELRYDARPLAKNSKIFHFKNQVWDNMFWTLASSVLVGTLWECLILWGYSNSFGRLITFAENPTWFIFLMLLIPIWSGFHFYWFHRLLHVGPLYKWVHSWHHKNVNTGPWSGHAMHPVEHVILYSDTALYLFIASHPVHVLFNLMLHTIAGPTSHCGYDKLKLVDSFKVQLGDFMHQLHHRFIDCNYGTYEDPWDKVFGTFHDGTPQADERIKQRRLKIYQAKRQSN